MKVSELKNFLKYIPDDIDIKIQDMEFFESDCVLDMFKKNDKTLNFIIPVIIKDFEKNEFSQELIENNYNKKVERMLANISIMCHFLSMTRENFLKLYTSVTSLEYDLLRDCFYADKNKYLNNLLQYKHINTWQKQVIKQNL